MSKVQDHIILRVVYEVLTLTPDGGALETDTKNRNETSFVDVCAEGKTSTTGAQTAN